MDDLYMPLGLLALTFIVGLAFALRDAYAEVRYWQTLVDRLLDQRDGKLP